MLTATVVRRFVPTASRKQVAALFETPASSSTATPMQSAAKRRVGMTPSPTASSKTATSAAPAVATQDPASGASDMSTDATAAAHTGLEDLLTVGNVSSQGEMHKVHTAKEGDI